MFKKLHSAVMLAALGVLATTGFAQEPKPGQAADQPAAMPEKAEIEAALAAQQAFEKFMEAIPWTKGDSGRLGGRADIKIPQGYRFTETSGTVKIMEKFGNLTSGSELGYIAPVDNAWFAVFEFDDCGYVKDDDKDKLDADKILDQLRKGQEVANERLAKLGREPLTVTGWHTPPFYNTQTNNLEWAIRLSSKNGETINYKTKLLGRRGVMDVVLVCDEEQMATVVPEYQKLLTGFAFNKSENYASYTKGDKVAEYGLTGLIVGGGLLVAAKSGLLAKLWKFILVGVVAVGAFIKRIFTGRSDKSI